jgi:UDP-N-acetylmuramyl pentapeptide phosphotransferase/UDP-N-acetylglucosamine-1-phosphate transferase
MGGVLGAIAIMVKHELVLIIVGGIFCHGNYLRYNSSVII